jgi:hypothetical protein
MYIDHTVELHAAMDAAFRSRLVSIMEGCSRIAAETDEANKSLPHVSRLRPSYPTEVASGENRVVLDIGPLVVGGTPRQVHMKVGVRWLNSIEEMELGAYDLLHAYIRGDDSALSDRQQRYVQNKTSGVPLRSCHVPYFHAVVQHGDVKGVLCEGVVGAEMFSLSCARRGDEVWFLDLKNSGMYGGFYDRPDGMREDSLRVRSAATEHLKKMLRV